MNSNVPLRLELKPSRTGFYSVLLAHAVAGMAIVLSSPPLWLHSTVALLWLLSLMMTVRMRHALSDRINGLVQRESGWQLGVANGLQPATFQQAFITRLVMVLRFRVNASGKTARVVVWHDSANADDIRRLRVRLLHGEAN